MPSGGGVPCTQEHESVPCRKEHESVCERFEDFLFLNRNITMLCLKVFELQTLWHSSTKKKEVVTE